MNILVTGANSFLGKEFASYFKDKKKYNLFLTSRKTLDVSNRKQVIKYFDNNQVDIVLHTAIKGGDRGREDTFQDFVENNVMFKNLSEIRDRVRLIINFGSGASFDRRRDIDKFSGVEIYDTYRLPEDYYGLSKNLICKEILKINENIVNFRIFGCFGIHEKESRFIKSSINNYKNGQPIIIHQDKEMDFFYVKDLCKVVEHYIEHAEKLPLDLNVVYQEKATLLDVANYINQLSDYEVKIKVLNDLPGFCYSGDADKLKRLNVSFKGLKGGIKEVYDNIMNGDNE